MDKRPFESMEDFTSRCREDGMDNFLAFAGGKDGCKSRACIGDGEEKDACLAMAFCMLDCEEMYTLVANAFRMATVMRRDAGKDTPIINTYDLFLFVEEKGGLRQ